MYSEVTDLYFNPTIYLGLGGVSSIKISLPFIKLQLKIDLNLYKFHLFNLNGKFDLKDYSQYCYGAKQKHEIGLVRMWMDYQIIRCDYGILGTIVTSDPFDCTWDSFTLNEDIVDSDIMEYFNVDSSQWLPESDYRPYECFSL